MGLFNALFGIKAAAVQESCVVMPFIPGAVSGEFGVDRLSRGELYGSGNGKFCTIFHTRMGSAFTGDAVLYLSKTPCRKLYFLGSCGLLRRTPCLEIGSLVSPSLCHAQESFTSLLSGRPVSEISAIPDPDLYRILINSGGGGEVKKVVGISAGSLKLQPEMKAEWIRGGIQVVDMESAAFLAAARQVKIPAAALMVISDIVGERPWYHQNDRELISGSLQTAARLLREIISKKQDD